MKRPITLEEAQAQYPNRFTAEWVPRWAAHPHFIDGAEVYYAPQYMSDLEWYASTAFPGEQGCIDDKHCTTAHQSWPLGDWLNKPYSTELGKVSADLLRNRDADKWSPQPPVQMREMADTRVTPAHPAPNMNDAELRRVLDDIRGKITGTQEAQNDMLRLLIKAIANPPTTAAAVTSSERAVHGYYARLLADIRTRLVDIGKHPSVRAMRKEVLNLEVSVSLSRDRANEKWTPKS